MNSYKDKLTVNLYPHQVIGVAWMLEQETSKPYAGLLIDSMGLGKSLQAIAVIVSKHPEPKPTLIVAPLAVLPKWKAEIETKVAISLRVLVYHGTERVTNFNDYDIVLTTYGTLSVEHPELERLCDDRKTRFTPLLMKERDAELAPKYIRRYGALLRQRWMRVVLDEAQMIKNWRARVSYAARALMASHRWCLSGTPIQNSRDEAISLMSFIANKNPRGDPENTPKRMQGETYKEE